MYKGKITASEVSAKLNITVDAVVEKALGEDSFSIGEAIALRNYFFPEMTLDNLFCNA